MSKDTQRMITAFRRVQEKLRESPTDAETARIYQRTSAYMEGRIGIWEITDRKFIRGVYHLFKAGIMARKIKWLAYAFVAPLVSKQQIEKIISLSTTQFIAGLRPSSTKLGKESKKEEGKRVGER